MELNEKIVNVATGEETIRPFTEEEIAEVERARIEKQNAIDEQIKADAAKEVAKSKLTALGLTIDDLKALGL